MASWLDDVFGQKPEVAPFKPTDPLQELSQLLGGEIKDWPQIENLSNLYETYMLGAYNQAIPGFSDILSAGGKDTLALEQQAAPLIKGEIPPDVAANVARSAAFQSLGAGTMGGPMGAALTARDLGLTSLDLMNQGSNLLTSAGNAAQRWAGIAGGLMLPPSAQLYSPQWFSEFAAQQKAAAQATKQEKFNVAAAPDPAAAGISGTLMNLLGAYLGSLGGGKLGGGGSGSITPSYGSIMGSSTPGTTGLQPAGGGGSGLMGLLGRLLGTSQPQGPSTQYAFGSTSSDVTTPGQYVPSTSTGMSTSAPLTVPSDILWNPFNQGDISLSLGTT